MPSIVLHLPLQSANPALNGRHMRLYQVIRDMAEVMGIPVQIRTRDADLTPATRCVTDGRFADGNLHIIDDRSVQAQNVLNCAVAYFWEFWHLDPVGTKALSSIGALPYDPTSMPYARAERFFANQRAQLVGSRRSKYGQKEAPTTLPDGALAVFLQGEFPIKQGVTSFDDRTMLAVVRAWNGDRSIVVKPHPLVKNPFALAELQAEARADDRITLADANVHDILARCAVTVSINSTVALEGFLHRKPAVLFGQADFHHFAGRVQVPQDFAAVLELQLTRRRGYAQYLAWYFLRHCLRLGSPGLETAIWARFAAVGFPKERFIGN
ncbi:MAG: hypothetical protein ACOH2H_10180 [Cypionkella sp.]